MLFVGNISTSNRKHACYSRFLIIYLRPMKTSQLFVPRRTESMVLIFPCTHNLNTKTSSLKIYTPDIPDSRLPQNQSSKAQSYHVSALFLTLKHHTQCKNFPSTVLTSRLSLPPWRTTVISPLQVFRRTLIGQSHGMIFLAWHERAAHFVRVAKSETWSLICCGSYWTPALLDPCFADGILLVAKSYSETISFF